jgi:hypothetical protein
MLTNTQRAFIEAVKSQILSDKKQDHGLAEKLSHTDYCKLEYRIQIAIEENLWRLTLPERLVTPFHARS